MRSQATTTTPMSNKEEEDFSPGDNNNNNTSRKDKRIRLGAAFLFIVSVIKYVQIDSVLSNYRNEIGMDINSRRASLFAKTENKNKNNDNNNDVPYVDENGEPLNVVVFYPDDWRYDAIEDEQAPGVVYTPFLTRLAREGIRFTHNAVTTSICWISRATLFTGRYVSQHHSERLYCPVFTLPQMWNGTWPYMLQKYGNYFVGHIGKWQFLRNKPSFNFSNYHDGKHWYSVKGNQVHGNDLSRWWAIKFLRDRPKHQNFAMTVAFYPPKPIGLDATPGAPWQPTEEFHAMYDNHTYAQPYNYSDAHRFLPRFINDRDIARFRYTRRFQTPEMYQEAMRHYYALVSGVDDACRRVVDELDRQGIRNKTMIIVTADNGMMLGAHGLAGKWHPYQESIRVPLIVYDPRMAKSKIGTTDDRFTLNIDLAATIIGAAKIRPDPRIQGRDLADIYVKRRTQSHHSQNTTSPPRREEGKEKNGSTAAAATNAVGAAAAATAAADAAVARFGVDTEPWRDDFYYEFPLDSITTPSTALVTRRYKYIRWKDKKKTETIFDLENDPYELHDLLVPGPPPLHLMEQVVGNATAATTTASKNVTGLLLELRARHDVLEEKAQTPFPGEHVPACSRDIGLKTII